ncbi:MAG: AraC family transcriptional regulator [Campylobacterales bacterium]|nr:AraC family transcriptional regulator [Campylobacterales bacterium]
MCKIKVNNNLKARFDSNDSVVKDSFPKDIGSDYMEKITIQNGFYLLKTDYNLKEPIVTEANTQNEKKFVITISQKGKTNYINKEKQKIEFKEGFTTISLFDKTEGIREFETKEVKQVRLILGEDFLQRNLKESLLEKYASNKQNLQILSCSPTFVQSQILVNNIINCNLKGELANLYIQGKSLELLSLELEKLKDKKQEIFLDEYDKDAIYKAKEILLSNMKNPPSIVELAKRVHLNEFKLKKGFKQVFETTPYKLLSKYKLNHAKELLQSSEYNINEIANLVGFKFANNFTNAFYNEFGVSPKELIKTRTYYF